MTPPPRKNSIIQGRPRAGTALGIAVSVLLALVLSPVLMVDRWIGGDVAAGDIAPVTIRVPQLAVTPGPVSGGIVRGGAIVAERGQTLDPHTASLAATITARRPGGPVAWAVMAAICMVLGLLYTANLRRSHNGKLVRAHIITITCIAGFVILAKATLLLTPVSTMALPVAAVALGFALALDSPIGLSTALVAAIFAALCSPFDPGALAVLTVQGVAAVLVLPTGRRRRWGSVVLAGIIGGLVAAAAYAVFYYLAWTELPVAELLHPGRSAWLAALIGGVLSGPLALLLAPVFQYLLGDITKRALVELEDLSHPLLKQIADNSPGTWQHSLAMANMADIAANAIGANARLTRVGAYYHDLGKSLQPKYFIENLHGGEPSPHDRLEPQVSTDAIFAHVTEGVRLARRSGLPERIIDFMHMHHGDGLLEYFWAKCQESGNAAGLSENDFRYPGIRPQSRETAILAICDAVEAASRTLKSPDDRAIRDLVQRIVYGKLHLGQLDESGLSVADLRVVAGSLVKTIKHAHHGRIEYPWQREARAERDKAEAEQKAHREPALGATERLGEVRLDSLDAPRPRWSAAATDASEIETALTEPAIDRDEGGEAPAETVLLGKRKAGTGGGRKKPSTIELLKGGRASAGDEDGAPETSELSPGVMVLGPPPKRRAEDK